MRRALVSVQGNPAGILEETTAGFRFHYDTAYLQSADPAPVSLTLPLRPEPFESKALFAFFEGLLAEGTLRDLQHRQFKIDADDSFGLLLRSAGSDVIGCVTVKPLPSPES
jgi:serine/threonine-protein kinase HipA